MHKQGIVPVISILQLFPLRAKSWQKRRALYSRRNKKGIVPVISILLMVMLTIAIMSGFYFWFSKIQSSSQQNTQQYSGELLGSIITETKIVDEPSYNTLAESKQCMDASVVFHMQNSGARNLDIDTSQTYLRIWNADEDTVCSNVIDGSCLSTNETRLYAGVSSISGQNGTVYYSPNGTSWVKLDDTPIEDINDIEISNEDVFYAGVIDAVDDPNIYKSCDKTTFSSDGGIENATGIYAVKYFKSETYVGDYLGNISNRSYGSWNYVFDTNESSVRALEVFNNYLYAGTYGDGEIWRSSNGASWSLANATLGNISALFSYNGYLYAGTDSSTASYQAQIFRSSDGLTWTNVLNTSDSINISVSDFDVLGGVLYAAVRGGNQTLYTSSDGATWTNIYNFTAESLTSYDLAVLGSYIYIGGENETAIGKIYRSPNGTGWEDVATLNTSVRSLHNQSICTKAVNCVQGCGSSIVPGETRLMELQLENTACDLASYGRNSKYFFKLTFGSEAQVSGRFDKKLLDASNTNTPCEKTYPMCNGFCTDTDPDLNFYCNSNTCTCDAIPPCDFIPYEEMDCSLGSNYMGCTTCSKLEGYDACYCEISGV